MSHAVLSVLAPSEAKTEKTAKWAVQNVQRKITVV
jgi:hypothetical protein